MTRRDALHAPPSKEVSTTPLRGRSAFRTGSYNPGMKPSTLAEASNPTMSGRKHENGPIDPVQILSSYTPGRHAPLRFHGHRTELPGSDETALSIRRPVEPQQNVSHDRFPGRSQSRIPLLGHPRRSRHSAFSGLGSSAGSGAGPDVPVARRPRFRDELLLFRRSVGLPGEQPRESQRRDHRLCDVSGSPGEL